MKKVFAIVAVILVISVVFVFISNDSQVDKIQSKQLENKLDALIESYKVGKVNVIDISSITSFKLEKLYLFGPYTTPIEIAQKTGLGLNAWTMHTTIETNDGIVLFLFVNKNEIVQYMDFHRNPDFLNSIRDSAFSPSNAIFVLNKKGQAIPDSP